MVPVGIEEKQNIQNCCKKLSGLELQRLAGQCQLALSIRESEFESYRNRGFFKRLWDFFSGNNINRMNKHIEDLAQIQNYSLVILNEILFQNQDVFLRISIQGSRIAALAEQCDFLGEEINKLKSRLLSGEKDQRLQSTVTALDKRLLPSAQKYPLLCMMKGILQVYTKLVRKGIRPSDVKFWQRPYGEIEEIVRIILNIAGVDYSECNLTFYEFEKKLKKEISKQKNFQYEEMPEALIRQLSKENYPDNISGVLPVGLLLNESFSSPRSGKWVSGDEYCGSSEARNLVDFGVALWYDLILAGNFAYHLEFEEKCNDLLYFSTSKTVEEITRHVLILAKNYTDLLLKTKEKILATAAIINQKILTAFFYVSKIPNYEVFAPEFTSKINIEVNSGYITLFSSELYFREYKINWKEAGIRQCIIPVGREWNPAGRYYIVAADVNLTLSAGKYINLTQKGLFPNLCVFYLPPINL